MRELGVILLLCSLLFTACEPIPDDIVITEFPIKMDDLKKFNKELDFFKGFKLVYDKGNIHFLNLTESNQFINLNLTQGTHKAATCDVPAYEDVEAINYDLEELTVLTKDSLLRFNLQGEKILTYPSPIAASDYSSRSTIYEESMHRYEDLLYFQLGNSNNEPSYLDENVLFFFNQDTSFKKFTYGPEYDVYLHYDELCVDEVAGQFFYLSVVTNRLYKKDITGKADKSILLDSTGFLRYDTSKFTDVLYLHKFSIKTKQNLKIVANEDHVFLVQRISTRKEQVYRFKCMVFDHDLNLLSEFFVGEEIEVNSIGICSEGVLFFIPDKSKVLLCAYQSA